MMVIRDEQMEAFDNLSFAKIKKDLLKQLINYDQKLHNGIAKEEMLKFTFDFVVFFSFFNRDNINKILAIHLKFGNISSKLSQRQINFISNDSIEEKFRLCIIKNEFYGQS